MPACLAPTCLLERPKMTRAMYHALKRHIIKERERKKQAEQEQDAMMDRLRKEREMRRKKEEEDTLTLEQTKEQVSTLEKKLEQLKTEKHDLFSQLKKVLHQEDETRRRTQIKEQQSEMMMHAHQGYPSHGIPMSGHPVMLQQISGRPALYKPPTSMIGVKRNRSPSPPPSTSYQAYSYPSAAKQGTHMYQHQQPEFKQGSYPQGQPVHVTYASQPSHTYQQQGVAYSTSQSPASKYNQANQSAFTSYPSHYGQHQQKQPIENYPPGYMLQRIQQQAGYIGSPHGAAGIIQQQHLEHANQKSSFAEDKYKMQQVREQARNYQSDVWPASAYPFQRGALRGKAPPISSQQPAMLQQQMQQMQAAASNKGSIVTGYPARTQAAPVSSAYQSPGQSTYHSQQQSGRP